MSSIEKRAQKLLAEAEVFGPAVDVEAIANHLRIRVEQAEFGDECSGLLVRKGDGAVIGVNFAHHPNRRRFTIAHEIGHFLLHTRDTYVDRTFLRFRDAESASGTNLEERQANLFAASLLMPEPWVRDAYNKAPFDQADEESLARLATTFGVSAQAMMFRLLNLGLVKA